MNVEVQMTDAPSPWSPTNPALQNVWDATSFGALMFCPRYYDLTIRQGWRGESVDLEFGILFASSVEVFFKRLLAGDTKAEAQLAAFNYAFDNSGVHDDEGKWTPALGSYQTMWRCTGSLPYKNEKGNRAKCPLSHAGEWGIGEGPTGCPHCGAPTEHSDRWLATKPGKDRYALVRLVVWYTEDHPEDPSRGLQPYAFPDGTPGVEFPFRVPFPRINPYGERYILAGYYDRIGVLGGEEHFIVDNKSTKKGLWGYLRQFTPNIQVDIYDLSSTLLFPDLRIQGVIIDAAQSLEGGAEFGLGINRRSDTQREELLEDLQYWLGQAEKFADEGRWPMNRRNCWNCPFAALVCGVDPASREGNLRANFKQQFWNPLEER